MPDFLLEIGCEEVPARMLDAGAQELRRRVQDLIERERLGGGSFNYFITPRRLAVMATGVALQQPSRTDQVTGPPVSIAYQDGRPTPAAHAFAKKAGLDVSQLHTIRTPKGEYVAAWVTTEGRSTHQIFGELLPKEVSSIYWPKSM